MLTEAKSSSVSHAPRGGERRLHHASYIAPEIDGKAPGGFVYITGSKKASSLGLSHDTSIETVAVRYFDIEYEQITATEGYRHAMFYFQTRCKIHNRTSKEIGSAEKVEAAYTSQRYCVQMNPMSFCHNMVDDASNRVWAEMEATLPANTELHKVPFVSITDDTEQTKNNSLGRFFFHSLGQEVTAHSNATVGALEKFAEEWVRKNPTYIFKEKDCRHFAHELYNHLKE